jgi:hypothetical protein
LKSVCSFTDKLNPSHTNGHILPPEAAFVLHRLDKKTIMEEQNIEEIFYESEAEPLILKEIIMDISELFR